MVKIGIIGVGKLGLCLAINLEHSGYQVHAFDKNHEYLNQLRQKTFNSEEPGVTAGLRMSQNIHFHDQINELIAKECKFIFILVATPSTDNFSYDHSEIDKTVDEILAIEPNYPINLIISSTVMPGYCDQLSNRIENNYISLLYNPEFIAQGSIIEDQKKPDLVLIGGKNEDAINQLKAIHETVCHNRPSYQIMSTISAEIAKIALNCFLTTKIAFANAIGDLANTANAEPNKILQAIGSDRRIGMDYLKYGFGFGGPCLPRDNQALLKFAEGQNHELELSKASISMNKKHLRYQFNELMKEKEPLVFSNLGFKKGSTSLENSQKLELAVMLAKEGKNVIIKESMLLQNKIKKKYPSLFKFQDFEE